MNETASGISWSVDALPETGTRYNLTEYYKSKELMYSVMYKYTERHKLRENKFVMLF